MAAITTCTLNLNGARSERKRACLFQLMKLKSINVMFVQETHSDSENVTDWRKEWDGDVILSHLTRTSGGVGILFAKGFLPHSCVVEERIGGRLLVVRAVYEHFTFVFVNVYAPTNGNDRVVFLSSLSETLKDYGQEHFLLLGGDFNCTENDELDRNHSEPHVASKAAMSNIIETYGLVDLWRTLYPIKRQYTWTHKRDKYYTMARLDRFYCFDHHLKTMRL